MQHTKYGCNVTKDFLKKILNYDYLDSSHIIFYQNLFKDMVKNERVPFNLKQGLGFQFPFL